MFRRATVSTLLRTSTHIGGSTSTFGVCAAPITMGVWARFASSSSSAPKMSSPTWTSAAIASTSNSTAVVQTKAPKAEMTPIVNMSQMAHFGNGPTRVTLARIGNTRSDVQANYTPTTTSSGSDSGSNSDPLPPHVRAHLMRVYNLLAISIGFAACGSSLMIFTGLGKMIPYWLPMVAGFVPLLWLNFKPPANPQARVALLLTFALIEGMALAPIVKMSAAAGVLGSALVLTAAVFGGFSAASFLAPRASLIAFQGPMFGMLMGMMAISLLNMIYPTAFAHSLILYGGLALFSVFIAVDTQAMIERARCGVSDPSQDALGMFLNVINIFVRIAQILRSMGE